VQGVLGNDSATMAEWRGGRAVGERYRLVPFDTVPLGEMGQHIDPAGGDAPWPGSLPDPPPALVWPQQRSAQVNDGEGRAVAVNRRGVYSAAPAKVSIEGGPWEEIVTWAGPWTTDERWWDAVGHRRRARFQVQVASGRAHLLTLEAQRWWVEATYD
jgi:protein ImuB